MQQCLGKTMHDFPSFQKKNLRNSLSPSLCYRVSSLPFFREKLLSAGCRREQIGYSRLRKTLFFTHIGNFMKILRYVSTLHPQVFDIGSSGYEHLAHWRLTPGPYYFQFCFTDLLFLVSRDHSVLGPEPIDFQRTIAGARVFYRPHALPTVSKRWRKGL